MMEWWINAICNNNVHGNYRCRYGWITNILAIKLLFRPLRPYKIPLLNYEIQGLLPKRKAEIASNIGKTVDEELLSIEDILNKMIEDEDKSNIVKAIKIRVNMIIDDKMHLLLCPLLLKNMIKEYVDTVSRGRNCFSYKWFKWGFDS